MTILIHLYYEGGEARKNSPPKSLDRSAVEECMEEWGSGSPQASTMVKGVSQEGGDSQEMARLIGVLKRGGARTGRSRSHARSVRK